MVSFTLDISSLAEDAVPSAILKVVQEMFIILSLALPARWNEAMSVHLTDALMNVSEGPYYLAAQCCLSCLTDTPLRSHLSQIQPTSVLFVYG
jgi:hypothetical protein